MIEKGTILTLEEGEYSDKQWHGPFKVLVNFNRQEQLDAFYAQWKPKDFKRGPMPDVFIAWLTKTGKIRDLNKSTSWYIGYSSLIKKVQ